MSEVAVLVIEDRPEIREALIGLLELKGYRACGAASCQQARQWLRQMSFRVILLDLRLPDGSGLALYDELRTLAPAAAVVILSGDSAAINEGQFEGRGAAGFLGKPFNFAQLEAMLQRVLGQQ
jgi:two-component system response regulator GlrR